MSLTQHDRRSLAERVAKRVAGHGIPRRAVESAVEHVAAALSRSESPVAGAAEATSGPELVAAFTAASAPDLASRVRRVLADRGITPSGLATATAGRHTVVTLAVAADRAALEQVATAAGARVSIVPREAR